MYRLVATRYNELRSRGYSKDVNVVENATKNNGVSVRKSFKVDFVVNSDNHKYYIQSAYNIPSNKKLKQEQVSLLYKNCRNTRKIVETSFKPLQTEHKLFDSAIAGTLPKIIYTEIEINIALDKAIHDISDNDTDYKNDCQKGLLKEPFTPLPAPSLLSALLFSLPPAVRGKAIST